MHIYLITNRVNGKLYIGKTERSNPSARWSEHRSTSKNPKYPLALAMRKHGVGNFTFEVIETVKTVQELCERETYWIRHFDTLKPKGYNLKLAQEPVNRQCPAYRAIMSKASQGRAPSIVKRKASSEYIGVNRSYDTWRTNITKDTVRYGRQAESEKEAALAYDRMALFLYGPDARLNFPHLKDSYTPEELQQTFDHFSTSLKSSRYMGVIRLPSGLWRGRASTGSTDSASTKTRHTSSEREAAEFVDVVQWLFHSSEDTALYNFPENLPRYRKLSKAWLALKHDGREAKGWTLSKGRFEARFHHLKQYYFCGSFSSAEEANAAVLEKKRELGAIWNLDDTNDTIIGNAAQNTRGRRMTCGTVTSDAFPIGTGILGVNVWLDRDKETKRIDVADSAAARCAQVDDSPCWTDAAGPVLWSNRSRTVRDVPLKRAPGVAK